MAVQVVLWQIKMGVKKHCNLPLFHNLRYHAKHLLEHAKRAVEIAIGQDKQTAIEWLESVSEVAAFHSSFSLSS